MSTRAKLWLLIGVAAVLGLVLPDLWTRLDQPGRPYWIETWYTDPGYQFLVPVPRQVTPEHAKGAPAAQVGLDLLRHAPPGLVSPLPPGTTARLASTRGAEAIVEVRLPRAVGSGEERLIVGSVVRTVVGTPGIDKVRVRMAGSANQPMVSMHEDLERSFSASSPEVRNSWDGETGTRITAWFRLKGTEYLVPLDMVSPIPDRPLEGTIRALGAPPPGGSSILERTVMPEAGLEFAGSPASGSYRVVWTYPDRPDDSWDRVRLVSATVLALTEGGRAATVEFRSPAGQIARKMPHFRLADPISRDDVRGAMKVALPPG